MKKKLKVTRKDKIKREGKGNKHRPKDKRKKIR